MRIVPILLLIFVGIVIFSCTKDLKIDSENTTKQLVVEGSIEPNQYPIVYLTRSSPYFQKIDSSTMLSLIASEAKVTVSTQSDTEILTLRYDKQRFPPYYYEGTSIVGKVGEKYRLQIMLNGKEYVAESTLNNPVNLKEIGSVSPTSNNEQRFLTIRFNDPINENNYYRVYTKRIGKDYDFIPCYLSTFSDFGFDGKEYTFEIIRSISSIKQTDNGKYFIKGDVVLIKLCSISKKEFDYWKNIEAQIVVSSNPFGFSSSEPPSLIKGNALGIWSALGSNVFIYKVI
jgi:hypothetical protein